MLERLLLGCGSGGALAAAAAMPVLAKAERVILASVEEEDPSLADGLADLASHLAWHGISAEIKLIPAAARAAGEMLMAKARSHMRICW
jgi:hypothetical protein